MQPKKRSPGRPASQDAGNAQENIVLAAGRHFALHGIKGTSNSMVAADAGVTPAMVHYYFRKKQDLYQAVLDTCFLPLLEKLQHVSTLEEWVRVFHGHLGSIPWLPNLMIREVLPMDGTLRTLFLQQIGPGIYATIRAMVEAESRRQNSGNNLNIERHVVLLMGMLVYPFLGLGLAENLTGRTFDNAMLEGFRDDALALFCKGIAGDRQEN